MKQLSITLAILLPILAVILYVLVRNILVGSGFNIFYHTKIW